MLPRRWPLCGSGMRDLHCKAMPFRPADNSPFRRHCGPKADTRASTLPVFFLTVIYSREKVNGFPRRPEVEGGAACAAPPLFQRFTLSRTRAVGSPAFFRRWRRQSASRITASTTAAAAAIQSCRRARSSETTVTVPLPSMEKQR